MKILYHHRIASKDGQYVHVEELTNAFIEQGHQLTFVAPEFSKKTDFGDDGGIARKLKKILPQFFYELLELSYSALIAYKLIKSILKDRPDFIYERYNTYQPMGAIVAKLFKIPLCLEVNAPLVEERAKHSGLALFSFAKVIENFTWRSADFIFPVSKVLARSLILAGVKDHNIHVIHNGINDQLMNSIFTKKDDFSVGEITIGFTGFINPWHRLDLALDAIAAHKDKNIKLVCVGDGDIKNELEQQALRLGIRDKVLFTGLASRDEVFNYIETFDIALQPSVTAYASPLKMFEYLAASCIIVAPDSDNILEILNDDNSILFKKDDYYDFSEKLTFAIDHLNSLTSKRVKARETIYDKGFTWQLNAKKITDLVLNK